MTPAMPGPVPMRRCSGVSFRWQQDRTDVLPVRDGVMHRMDLAKGWRLKGPINAEGRA